MNYGVKNIKSVALSLIMFISTSVEIYSQKEPVFQFAAGLRMDFIGLKNYENKNYYLSHGEADVSVSVLTDNLKLFKGGELYVQAMGLWGNKSSENYAGDLQVFSNIESDSRIFLYQCWYQQTFNKFIIKLGQLDLNTDYSVSGYGSSLINSSFGVIPTISLNMPVSIFSYLTAGVSLRYTPDYRITFQTAFFNGDPGDYETNRYNLNWRFGKKNGWFNISEIHYKTKSNIKQGKYKAGIFYHSKTIPDCSYSSVSKGNFGFFVMGDQWITLERNTIKNGLCGFFELSLAPSKNNIISNYYGLGLMYRGLINGMNEDECTIALASAHLNGNILSANPEYFPHETALEFTYKKYFGPNFIIQPDFQYIINTGASRLLNGNSWIGILRAMAIF
jgi:porin